MLESLLIRLDENHAHEVWELMSAAQRRLERNEGTPQFPTFVDAGAGKSIDVKDTLGLRILREDRKPRVEVSPEYSVFSPRVRLTGPDRRQRVRHATPPPQILARRVRADVYALSPAELRQPART